MEKIAFNFDLVGKPLTGNKIVCGVVGSGNLEVIIEENATSETQFTITTAVENYQKIWAIVIEDFIREYQPVGLQFTINDSGATPPVVSLRLRQALELFQGYQKMGHNYLELAARERITALVDPGSFKEWLADEPLYSPHLAALGLTGEADDGVIVGEAAFSKKNILIAAQQKDFLGGGVGEIHGAKLTGLFEAAVKLKVAAVLLLIDSGGVRLHEANAGEIAISEIVRAIFNARNAGITTIGVVCGKNGAFGGMGIISACLDYLIVNEIARIGVSGPEVIQAVKGVEAFDAQDRALVWRVYGGKTRYLQDVAHSYVGFEVDEIISAIQIALTKSSAVNLPFLKQQHTLLEKRLQSAKNFTDEGAYLEKKYPEFAEKIFEMNTKDFLAAANIIKTNCQEE